MLHSFFSLSRVSRARLTVACALYWCVLLLGAGCQSSFGDDVAGGGSETDPTETDPGPTDVSDPDAGEPTEPATDDVDAGALGPQLVNTVPRSGAMDVETSVRVSLTFDQPVEAGEGSVRLFESITQTQVAEVAIDGEGASLEGDTLVVDWDTQLANSTAYYVLVDPGAVLGAAGRPFVGIASATAFAFTTEAPAELSLVSSSPANGATRVPRASNVTLTFSAPILAAGEGDVIIVDADREEPFEVIPVSDPARLSFDGARLIVDPHGVFDYGRRYYLTVDPGALRSAQGVEFPGFDDDGVLSFTTVPPPVVRLLSSVPAKGATNVDPRASLVLTFSEAVATGTGFVKLWERARDALVEEVDVAGPRVTLSDANVTIDWVNDLEFDTSYYVTVDAGALLSQRGARFEGISDPTGLDFSTAATDLGTVALEGTSPLAGAVDVPVTTELVLVFSEAVQRAAGTIAIFEADGTLVQSVDVSDEAHVTIDGDTVTVVPGLTLDGSTLHYVRVSAGSFQNARGAAFAGISDESVWTFTTEQVFGVVALSPADDATAVDPATDLVLTFSESVAAGSGNIAVYTSADVLVESVPVTSARVAISGATVTVEVDRILGSETGYYVRIDAGALTHGGGSWSGISSPSDWNFTTRRVDFPGNVSSGLVAWLDASYAASVKANSSAQTRFWADRSGRHNDVSASGDARPALSASAINAKPALRFDGTDDVLQAASGFSLTAFDVFVVWQSPSAAGSTMSSIVVNGTNFQINHGHPYDVGRNSTAICQGNCSTTSLWHGARFVPAPNTNTPYLWNAGFDPITTTILVRSQGSAPVYNTSPTATPSAPATPFAIGGGCPDLACFFRGDVAEVLVYSRLLTSDERMAVVAGLRSKWGLPQVACSAGETRGSNGSCYHLGTSSANWDSARSTCQGRGTGWDLATVRSATENDWLTGNLLSADAWFGGTDANVEGVWRWVTDGLQFWAESTGAATNSSYTNWLGGSAPEPTGGTAYNCIRYYRAPDGSFSWADFPCSQSIAYVCEGPGD